MINFDTFPTDADPSALILSVDHVRRQHDSQYLLGVMETISGHKAVVWGDDNIGFGEYNYVYKTGRTGTWPIISFSPSVQSIEINVLNGFDNYADSLEKIGRVKHTSNTLVLHSFSDISKSALESFVKRVYHDILNKQKSK